MSSLDENSTSIKSTKSKANRVIGQQNQIKFLTLTFLTHKNKDGIKERFFLILSVRCLRKMSESVSVSLSPSNHFLCFLFFFCQIKQRIYEKKEYLTKQNQYKSLESKK